MNTPRILIVEDDSLIALDLKRIVLGLGYELSGAVALGREAVALAASQPPEAVLMDISLRGSLDGIETAQLIKQEADIPIIFITAHSDPKTLQRAKLVGPFGYILKPFDDEMIRVTLEMALYKHKVDRELKESRQWLATTLSSIGDAVIATDAHGRIKFMNPIAATLTGWVEAEDRNLADVFKIVNEQTRQPLENPVEKVLNHKTIVGLTHSTMLIARDGLERYIDAAAGPIYDDDGEITGVVLTFRDITERKRLEAKLYEAQKMESIGRLAGGIAHDFNNLLTVMIGNTDLALTTLPEDHPVRHDILQIRKSATRAAALTGQLLAFARRQISLPETVNLNQLILNLSDILQRLIGKDIELITVLANDAGLVKIDPNQFEQILVNLAANARDAMPAGGRFTLATSLATLNRDEVCYFDNLPPGDYVLLTASDTGAGMAAEVLNHIFEPFFTTKEVGKGIGLGLAMAHGIIKQVGGDIKVQSELNQGTTFKIYLPREGDTHGN